MNISTSVYMTQETSIMYLTWIIIFSLLLISSLVMHYFMVSFISDKPPGSTTIFDLVVKDTLRFSGCGVTVFCLIDIVSRFEWVRNICRDYPTLLIIPCVLYVHSFASVCIHMGTICTIRVFCILNLTFMEDAVGEDLIRVLAIVFTLFWSIGICTLFIVIDDIYSGTPMTLFTHHVLPTGT